MHLSVGVIGAGVMGTGVAQAFAQRGFDVFLMDISWDILDKAKDEIDCNVRFQSMFSKADKGGNPGDVQKHITYTMNYECLKDVDFIVENVTEDWNVKKNVYTEIDNICKENCIFLVNTSCIPITQVAGCTNRKGKVIGTHFMNPVYLKKTIEVIKGYHTSQKTIDETVALLDQIGKESIIVNDLPGFVSNRISHLFMNEAAFVVFEQVASPEDVDDIFKKCYGHKMGPLETADLIGLDTVVNSLDVLYENFQDSKFRCCPLLRQMVAAGVLGKKSGQGFYTYYK